MAEYLPSLLDEITGAFVQAHTSNGVGVEFAHSTKPGAAQEQAPGLCVFVDSISQGAVILNKLAYAHGMKSVFRLAGPLEGEFAVLKIDANGATGKEVAAEELGGEGVLELLLNDAL